MSARNRVRTVSGHQLGMAIRWAGSLSNKLKGKKEVKKKDCFDRSEVGKWCGKHGQETEQIKYLKWIETELRNGQFISEGLNILLVL